MIQLNFNTRTKLLKYFRFFVPGLHVDLISYWPLDESSGVLLHDTSMYGYSMNKTLDFGTNLFWQYDPSLTGILLYSKYYQTNVNNAIPEVKQCVANCLYCGTVNYCTMCALGLYVSQGNCNQVQTSPNAIKDVLERDYKFVDINTLYCLNEMCMSCNDTSSLFCVNGFCIRNALYYDLSCYNECPLYSYNDTLTTCASCPQYCVHCSSATICTQCEAGSIMDYSTSLCVITDCGNSIVEPPETCDDGNQVSGDGCSNVCLVEPGFTCIPLPSGVSDCIPICGDGKFFGLRGEQCDDGNTISGDGCDSTCRIEAGWWCINGNSTHPSQCHCSPLHVNYLDSYSNNYMTLSLKFSKPLVLMVGTSDSALLCLQIFGQNVSLFGNNYSCQILTDLIQVNLDTLNKIQGGDILQITPGILGCQSCIETFSGNVTTPTIPMQTITGNIIVPTFVSYCYPFTIYLTNIQGGIGKPYILFALTADITVGGNNIAMINSELKLTWLLSNLQLINDTTYSVIIPANSLLPDVQYTIELEIINFQGIQYKTAAIFSTTSNTMVDILLEGLDTENTLSIYTIDEVYIRARLSMTQCKVLYPNISLLNATYKQTSKLDVLNLTKFTSKTASNKALYIPANTLKAGVQYDFQVNVISSTYTVVTGSTSFSIIVSQKPLQVIVSPYSQVIASDQQLVINGSESYDRNITKLLLF